MDKIYSITVDIGTTNSKISLFEIKSGKLIQREKFKTFKINDDFGELFDIERIWKALVETVIDFTKKYPNQIDVISISSVGEAGLLLDLSNNPVTPMIAWYDTRSHRYIDKLTDEELEVIYSITGLPAHSNYSLSKIKWMVDTYNLDTNKSFKWLNLPDYLVYLLTGTIKTEYSMASRTMVYSLKDYTWSEEVLDIFKLKGVIKFPEVVESGTIIGYTDDSSCWGLKEEHIGVAIAGHDHMVGARGINLNNTALLNSTGTTEGLLAISPKVMISQATFQSSLTNGIYMDKDYYTLFSSIPVGGKAFEWYQKLFNLSYEFFKKECDALYEKYMNGAIDFERVLLMVPHLSGSGAPFKNSHSRGMIYNLDTSTRREDVLLGLLLGVVLELKLVSCYFINDNIDKMDVIGPAVKNKLWLQLKADALNIPVVAVNNSEAVSFGALSAVYGEKYAYTIDGEKINPINKNVEIFDKLIHIYQDLYEIKKEITLKYKNVL